MRLEGRVWWADGVGKLGKREGDVEGGGIEEEFFAGW